MLYLDQSVSLVAFYAVYRLKLKFKNARVGTSEELGLKT